MNMLTHSTDAATVLKEGYFLYKKALSASQLHGLNEECQRLTDKAANILHTMKDQSYAEFYERGTESFIAVPETGYPLQTCRFEYIVANSDFIRYEIVPLCANAIKEQIGYPVTLFKDKCNLKSPGGGAFTPHQDIPAYMEFGPQIYVTAAVFLDDATAENGALEVALNVRDIKSTEIQLISTPWGNLPILPTALGGKDNGRIIKEVEQQLKWKTVFAKAGDIILFDSYIPHRSAVNQSLATRRAFFFTFNLQQDGDLYEIYYQTKRSDFGHLRFHIATPTVHNGLP